MIHIMPHVMPHDITCNAISFHVTCQVMSDIISHPIMSHVMSSNMSCHVISNVMLCHISHVLSNFMPCYVTYHMSCHISFVLPYITCPPPHRYEGQSPACHHTCVDISVHYLLIYMDSKHSSSSMCLFYCFVSVLFFINCKTI